MLVRLRGRRVDLSGRSPARARRPDRDVDGREPSLQDRLGNRAVLRSLRLAHPQAPEERAAQAIAAGAAPPDRQLGARPTTTDGALSGSGGAPLPADVRAQHEAALGANLGAVRVHDDGVAHQFAAGIGAQAATWGAHVYFAPGRYRPSDPDGGRLLAHELAHTLQPDAGDVVHRSPATEAALRQVDEQLASVVITDDYRAQLQQRRRSLQHQEDLEALNAPPDAPASPASDQATEEMALRDLVPVPEPATPQAAYEEMVQNPALAIEIAQQQAATEATRTYLDDKLDWRVVIEPRQVPGADGTQQTWYEFSVQGEALIDSSTRDFPISALDSLAQESLQATALRVAARYAQVVQVAVLDAAYDDLAGHVSQRTKQITDDLSGFPFDEARGTFRVANEYLARLDALAKSLDPANGWLAPKLQARSGAFRPIAAAAGTMLNLAAQYHAAKDPARTAGEIYDESIEDADEAGGILGFLDKWSDRGFKLMGNIATGGGQSLTAANARAFRAGSISYDDYVANQYWNLGRVAVTGIVSALTAGEATEPALGLLGIEEGGAATAAGQLVGGSIGGFAGSFSSDVYAKIVSHVSSSPGVQAFHEQSVGGPAAWFEGAIEGGLFGRGAGALGARFASPPTVPALADAGATTALATTDATALAAAGDSALSTAADVGEPAVSVPDQATPAGPTALVKAGPVPGTIFQSGPYTGTVQPDGSLYMTSAEHPGQVVIIRDGVATTYQQLAGGGLRQVQTVSSSDAGAPGAPSGGYTDMPYDAEPESAVGPGSIGDLPAGGVPSLSLRRVQNFPGTGRDRGLAYNAFLAESYGGEPEGPGTSVQTPLGLRRHDVNYVEIGRNGQMAVEGKNYKLYLTRDGVPVRQSVRLTPELREQAYKDVLWMREGRKQGVDRLVQWEFAYAPPTEALANFLTSWGIPVVVTINPGL